MAFAWAAATAGGCLQNGWRPGSAKLVLACTPSPNHELRGDTGPVLHCEILQGVLRLRQGDVRRDSGLHDCHEEADTLHRPH